MRRRKRRRGKRKGGGRGEKRKCTVIRSLCKS